MGVYDIVGKKEIQIKCTPEPKMDHYDIGDEISLKDGLYLGYEGFFVVGKGKVKYSGDKIFTKWGDKINPKKVLDSYNEIAIICERWKEIKKILDAMSGVIKEGQETEWLSTPNEDLNNDTPLEVISRGPEGVKQVLELLHNIEYGIPT